MQRFVVTEGLSPAAKAADHFAVLTAWLAAAPFQNKVDNRE
jgi:hypothetical protein